MKTGDAAGCLEGHSDAVTALCVPSGGLLASASWDSTIRLWDIKIDALVAIAPNRIVAGDVRGLLHWLEILD